MTKTNIDFITKYMESGALNQLFVINALNKEAEKVSKLTDEQVEELDQESQFINMWAWRESARQWIRESNDFYGHQVDRTTDQAEE